MRSRPYVKYRARRASYKQPRAIPPTGKPSPTGNCARRDSRPDGFLFDVGNWNPKTSLSLSQAGVTSPCRATSPRPLRSHAITTQHVQSDPRALDTNFGPERRTPRAAARKISRTDANSSSLPDKSVPNIKKAAPTKAGAASPCVQGERNPLPCAAVRKGQNRAKPFSAPHRNQLSTTVPVSRMPIPPVSGQRMANHQAHR